MHCFTMSSESDPSIRSGDISTLLFFGNPTVAETFVDLAVVVVAINSTKRK